MKRHVAGMSWVHFSSSLKLCGGHETPDNLMRFDFKMPPALFLCWARTVSQFSSPECLKSQEDSIDPSRTRTRTPTHSHIYTYSTHATSLEMMVGEIQLKVLTLQGFFSLFRCQENEFHVESFCGLHSTRVVITHFTGISDVALRFAFFLPDIKELL